MTNTVRIASGQVELAATLYGELPAQRAVVDFVAKGL